MKTAQEIKTICESGIEFKINKKGKKMAYYYSYAAMRNMRVPLALAEELIATEQTVETELFWAN